MTNEPTAQDETGIVKAQNPYAVPSPSSENAAPTAEVVAAPETASTPEVAEVNDPNLQRANELLELIDNLISVLNEETELLETPRSRELEPVVKRKQALFAEYDATLGQSGDLKALMQELTVEKRNTIMQRARQFETALIENEAKLDAVVRASQTIMNVITEVAAKAAQPVQGYGRYGSINTPNTPSAPVAINKTL